MNRNNNACRNNLAGLTLSAVLNDSRLTAPEESPRFESFRTLLDIIQEEQAAANAHIKDNKTTWKNFKDKLRIRRGGPGHGSSWTSSMRVPASEIPTNRHRYSNNRGASVRLASASGSNQSIQPDITAVPDVDRELMSYLRNRSPSLQRNASQATRGTSGRLEQSNSFAMPMMRTGEDEEDESPGPADKEAAAEEGEGEEEEEEEEGEEEDGGGDEPVRMSLMALLAETDRQMGLDESAYTTDEDEDDSDVEYNTCCVCMVRHKGAALIPCGHTFCRLCCRELLVQRGSCPLCNNYIVEILDNF